MCTLLVRAPTGLSSIQSRTRSDLNSSVRPRVVGRHRDLLRIRR
ncbi:hypothetical protein ACFQ0H_31520 [Lysobacter gummosus]